MTERLSPQEAELIARLHEHKKLRENIGTGEVTAASSTKNLAKIGSARAAVDRNIIRIGKKLQVQELKDTFPVVRKQFHAGLLEEEEFAPYREKMEELGLQTDEDIMAEFSQLGLKGDQLNIVSVLANASVDNPLTSYDISEALGIGVSEFEEKTYYRRSEITNRFPAIRKKLRKGGYRLVSVDTPEKNSPHGYFLMHVSPESRSDDNH